VLKLQTEKNKLEKLKCDTCLENGCANGEHVIHLCNVSNTCSIYLCCLANTMHK